MGSGYTWRTMVTIGQKGGVYHALDARTGEVLWEDELAPPNPTHHDPGSMGIEWGSAFEFHFPTVRRRAGPRQHQPRKARTNSLVTLCEGGDSNPDGCYPLAPQASASTSSAILARST